MLDLAPAAYQVIRLLEGVTQEHLAHPTPCVGTPVAGLLDHFLAVCLAFTLGARKITPQEAAVAVPRADPGRLDPNWRILLPERLDQLADAWRNPGAWQGVAAVSGVPMPAEDMGVVALDELVVHGWDLARATGQSFACDPASTEAVLRFTMKSARPENAATRLGVFGPVVEVSSGAPPLDRALGYAGRDPQWTPAAAGRGRVAGGEEDPLRPSETAD